MHIKGLEVLLNSFWVCDAVAVVQKLFCTLFKTVQHKVLLLITVLVAHLGLRREWIKLPQLCFACIPSLKKIDKASVLSVRHSLKIERGKSEPLSNKMGCASAICLAQSTFVLQMHMTNSELCEGCNPYPKSDAAVPDNDVDP